MTARRAAVRHAAHPADALRPSGRDRHVQPDAGVGDRPHPPGRQRRGRCVIAPATANVIAKLAHGIADDLLTTVLLATRAPLVLAPAMNVHMWEHPAVQENLARAGRARGARRRARRAGRWPAATRARGGSPSRRRSSRRSRPRSSPQDLAGERVLVSAGPTRGGRSIRCATSRTARAARWATRSRAWRAGAARRSTLVSGPTALAAAARRPRRARHDARARCARARATRSRRRPCVVMAAAVADYRPRRAARRGSSRRAPRRLALELERNARHPRRPRARARAGGSWSASPPRRTTSSRRRARKLRDEAPRPDRRQRRDRAGRRLRLGHQRRAAARRRRASTRRCRSCPRRRSPSRILDWVARPPPARGGASGRLRRVR